MPLEKQKPERDALYLEWIRSLPCLSCGHRGVDAHHTTSAGMGQKGPDIATVPLCRPCHIQLHTIGWVAFEAEKSVNLREAAKRYREWFGARCTRLQRRK